jgi:hypothetical protein
MTRREAYHDESRGPTEDPEDMDAVLGWSEPGELDDSSTSSPEIEGLVIPAICHALAWINEPRDPKRKLVRLGVLQVITGMSNTFAAACSVRVDQSTIQKGVKRAREEFGL